MRRAGLSPERVTAEQLAFATENIFSICAEYCNAGFPLWTREFMLLGAQIGSPDVPTPFGTVDVMHTYWRTINPYRGPDVLSSGATDQLLFGGQPNTDVVIAGPNPAVAVAYQSPTEIDTIGVLLGGSSSVTAALQVQTAPDGQTWTTVQTLPSATYVPQNWTYFDLNPTIKASFVQLVNPGASSWTLNQLNFGLSNGQDIEIGPLNIDQYYNQPDKLFRSDRATSAFLDRQVNAPVIKIWPTINNNGFYNGTISALARRYIQDPGLLTNNVEVPARWLEALQWRLATTLIWELPDLDEAASSNPFGLQAKQQRIQAIEQKATKAELLMWSEERSHGSVQIAPSVACYTK